MSYGFPNYCNGSSTCKAIVHNLHCYNGPEVKEYLALPWWKRLFTKDPRFYC